MSVEIAAAWVNKLWCIHIIEYHKDVKMNFKKCNTIDYFGKYNSEESKSKPIAYNILLWAFLSSKTNKTEQYIIKH